MRGSSLTLAAERPPTRRPPLRRAPAPRGTARRPRTSPPVPRTALLRTPIVLSVGLPRRARADSIGRSALSIPPASKGRAGGKAKRPKMNRNSVYALLLVAASVTGACQKPAAPTASPSPSALGHDRGREDDLRPRRDDRPAVRRADALSEKELEILQRGVRATARGGQPEFPVGDYAPKFDALAKSRAAVGSGRQQGAGRGLPRRGGCRSRSGQARLGSRLQDDQARQRREPEGHGRRARALSRHAPGRQGLRQLRAARPAGRVPAQPGDPVLDRGRPAHEGGREGEARVPVRDRLRRRRHARRQHPSGRDAGVRGRAARNQGR